MRYRIVVTAAAVLGLAGASSLTARGVAGVCCVESHACCEGGAQSCCVKHDTQWSIANFVEPVMVNRTLVSGPVLIVHDDAKMARGEPCTTFYRFDTASGPGQALVSFHCKPRRANRVGLTQFTTEHSEPGIRRLVEYQIAGDSEAHGIPR